MIFKTTESKVKEALKTIRQNGGEITVVNNTGCFDIQGISGHFIWHEEKEEIEIDIEDKPFLIPMSVIDRKVKEFFN